MVTYIPVNLYNIMTGELSKTGAGGSNEKEFWERSKKDLIGQFQRDSNNLISQSERISKT